MWVIYIIIIYKYDEILALNESNMIMHVLPDIFYKNN